MQRFQKIGKVQDSKLWGRGEEERSLHCRTQMRGPQKAQGVQNASASEPRPASPNLGNSASFPTRPSTYTSPDVRLSSYSLQRASFLTFPVFLPVYGAQSSPVALRPKPGRNSFSSQVLARNCPAQSPEVQPSHPFSHHFTATQRTWHRALLRTNTLPLSTSGLQRRPVSLFLQEANLPSQATGSSFLPKKGMRLDLRSAARGVSEKG